ncbi:MAG: hypothetical protein ABIH00_11335 [Armatimonadota bacterium]
MGDVKVRKTPLDRFIDKAGREIKAEGGRMIPGANIRDGADIKSRAAVKKSKMPQANLRDAAVVEQPKKIPSKTIKIEAPVKFNIGKVKELPVQGVKLYDLAPGKALKISQKFVKFLRIIRLP